MKKDADGNGYAWIPVKIAELAIERITADATLVQATASLHEDMIQTLKAELAQLRLEKVHYLGHLGESEAENVSLKAEIKRLEAVIESLIKAGDAMAALIKYEPGVNTFDPIPQVVKKWNAAKEGNPSV